jgi:hypothetical protein
MRSRFTRRSLGRGLRNTLVASAVARFAAEAPRAALAAPANQLTTTDGRIYDAYVQPVPKFGQFYSYTCEFDAAWVVLATFGIDRPFEDMLEIVGHDVSVEPWYEETASGFIIYGGDITSAFSGDYTSNLLARASGMAFKPLFEHFNLTATPVGTQEELQAALDAGQLVWTKATVDFLPWADTTWITPDGKEVTTVLGNDHAVVINGYNQDVVVITDPLGPTSTNWSRPYEYEVPWATFLNVWAAQAQDALAVSPAEMATTAGSSSSITESINPTAPIVEIAAGG